MALAKRLALDTNVLFDRANGEPFAIEFCEAFQRSGFSLEVPPTVIAELNYFRNNGTNDEQRTADVVLRSLLIWGLTPRVLSDIQMTYRNNFVALAQDEELLPPGEINDLRILAETSISEIPALVTSDHGILDVDPKDLQRVFDDAGLSFVSPVHPKRMLEILSVRSN